MPMVGKQDQRERISNGFAPFGWSFCTGFEDRLLLQPFLDLMAKRSEGHILDFTWMLTCVKLSMTVDTGS